MEMNICPVTYNSAAYQEMLTLRNEVLRRPWGLILMENDLREEANDVFIACYDDNRMVGCCILTEQTADRVKLRQMAVHPDWQRKNAGKEILSFAEQYAGEHGYTTVVLHARETASGFYAKCGYSCVGNTFVEIGMPHVLMKKTITGKKDVLLSLIQNI